MKLPTPPLLVLLAASSANAFTIVSPSVSSRTMPTTRSSTWVRESSTAVAEKPDATETGANSGDSEASVYARLGISKDQLAMGIDPEKVLEWIGTRDDMVEKVMQDINKFDRVQAEKEIDKYLMDPEAVNYHIEFKKRLAENPSMIQPEEKEGFFSFRTVVIGYVSYVFGEIIYRQFLEDYVDLSFVPGWGPKEVVDAASSAAVDVIQNSVDAASTAVDAM